MATRSPTALRCTPKLVMTKPGESKVPPSSPRDSQTPRHSRIWSLPTAATRMYRPHWTTTSPPHRHRNSRHRRAGRLWCPQEPRVPLDPPATCAVPRSLRTTNCGDPAGRLGVYSQNPNCWPLIRQSTRRPRAKAAGHGDPRRAGPRRGPRQTRQPQGARPLTPNYGLSAESHRSMSFHASYSRCGGKRSGR